MIRKTIGALALLAVLTGAAAAQDYPNRPIKFLHGFPPGGNVDIIARLLGNEMSKGLGQSIIVEAKPGVAGSLAAETVARSEPDGYTLLVVPSAHPAHGALSKNVNYKVVDDFEWISVASFYPFLICVRKDSRFQSLKQLIDEARKNPAGLTYGSAGVGSILHTTVELMANETKTKYLHVPYRGEAPAITGLLQGDIDFIAATSGPISARIRSGEFRALAVTGKLAGATSPTCPPWRKRAFPDSKSSHGPGSLVPRNCPSRSSKSSTARCVAPLPSPRSRASSRAWAATRGRPRRARCARWWRASWRRGPSSPRKPTSRSTRRWLDARRVGRSGCVGGVVRVY